MKSTIVLFVLFASVIGRKTFCPSQCLCEDDDTTVVCKNKVLVHIPKEEYSKKLKTLDLSNNRIPSLKNYLFVDNLIYTLEKLILSNNIISMVEPESLRGLSSLTYLDLSYNDIADIHSTVFDNVQKLKTLLLNGNPALSLPEMGFDLPALRVLNLNGCELKNIPTNFFEKMPKLETIIISNNKLESFDSNIIHSLSSLTRLDLNLNKLENLYSVINSLPKSLNLLNILDNQWICDCELKNTFSMYESKIYKQMLTCSSPSGYENINVTREVIERLIVSCTTTTTTTTTEISTTADITSDTSLITDETYVPNDDFETLNETSAILERRSDDIRYGPPGENEDIILHSDVGSSILEWFGHHQWWVVTITTLTVLIICIVAINYRVNRFRHQQSKSQAEMAAML